MGNVLKWCKVSIILNVTIEMIGRFVDNKKFLVIEMPEKTTVEKYC
jgi:hypothetical protein